MAGMKDILDDDDRRLKPLPLLLAVLGGALGVMIVTNALSENNTRHQALANKPALFGKVQQAGVTPQDGSGTVILKYDPLIEDMQRELLASGFYRGNVDGVNGINTRQAIAAYQQANGLPQTGEASEDLVNQLRFTRKVQQAAQYTGSVNPAEPVTASVLTPMARQEPTPLPVTASDAQFELNVKKVQVALAGMGYEISRLDGQVSDETRAAILKFEMDNGMDMLGTVDGILMNALKVK